MQYRDLLIPIVNYQYQVYPLNGNLDYTVKTTLSMDETITSLEDNLKQSGYGVLSKIDVMRILKEKNSQEIEPYVILNVCSPVHAGEAMERHRELGIILPCKISVHDENGRTELSLLRPTTAMAMTGISDMNEFAQAVEKELMECMDKTVEQTT